MPKVSEPTSNSNTSSNAPVLTITAKPRYDVGENIVVNFVFESSKSDANDWIGIYSSAEKMETTSLTIMWQKLAKQMDRSHLLQKHMDLINSDMFVTKSFSQDVKLKLVQLSN